MCHQVFETLDLNSSCKFIFIQKGVQLRKVSQWPPWLIKIFRKRIPGVHNRVNYSLQKSLPAQELLGHADFSLVGDLAEEDGLAPGHDHGPSRVKMFRDTLLTGSPYYVRAY